MPSCHDNVKQHLIWSQWQWIWNIEVNGVREGKVVSFLVVCGTTQERSHAVSCDAFALCPKQYTEPDVSVRVTTTPTTRLWTCLPLYCPAMPRPDKFRHRFIEYTLASIFCCYCMLVLSPQTLTFTLYTVTTM